MSAIERLRALHDWAWTDPTWGASWPGEPEKRCPSCDAPWPCDVRALLDERDALREALEQHRDRHTDCELGAHSSWCLAANLALARLDGAS